MVIFVLLFQAVSAAAKEGIREAMSINLVFAMNCYMPTEIC